MSSRREAAARISSSSSHARSASTTEIGCRRSTFQTLTSPALTRRGYRRRRCYRSAAVRATATLMLTFASDAHRQHHPRQPFHDRDGLIVPPEVPERAERIRAAIDAAGIPPSRHRPRTGSNQCCACTPQDYLDFLEHAHATLADDDGRARRRRSGPVRTRDPRPTAPRAAASAIADLGWYSHDNDAILAGTWAAAVGAVDVTLSAWRRRRRRSRRLPRTRSRGRRATTRPPTPTPATASSTTRRSRRRPGPTAAPGRDPRRRLPPRQRHAADLLRARRRVFVSLHADPARRVPVLPRATPPNAAPGRGDGFTHNFPLPLGTAWDALRSGARRPRPAITSFGPDALVVSLGVDTAAEDPDTFRLVADDFTRIGARDRRASALPTLLVQEGGYDLERDRPQRRERAARQWSDA